MNASSHFYRTCAAAVLLGSFGLPFSSALAQTPAFDDPSSFGFAEDLRIPDVFSSTPTAAPINRIPRLRLFRIAPGFLADPLGMQDDDFTMPGVTSMPGSSLSATRTDAADGPEWIQVGMGSDNPYFDLRRPGDPGGFGYFRVNTQVSLLDTASTACSLGIQAVTPAGAQFGGLPDGPTVFTPAFSVFHAINDRLALQGFVCKNVPLSNADNVGWLQRNLQYGLALQRPLLADGPERLRNVFFTVGALGQISPERDNLRLIPNYDVLPGLQWHVHDNWWMSSAVLVPLGSVRAAPGQWQLTCSLQF
jgi:hypothetical protein